MKNWIIAGLAVTALSGCAQLEGYSSAVKTPPPASLVGNWQTMGAQKGLVSPEARASLIITAAGDTLDCRQWQRVIAKPGKTTLLDGDWVNINNQSRVMPLELEGSVLHYDKLTLSKVNQPTAECQKALADNAAPAAAQAAAEPTATKSGKHYSGVFNRAN